MKGCGVSAGIASGEAVVFKRSRLSSSGFTDCETELESLNKALTEFKTETENTINAVSKNSERAKILKGHISLVFDIELLKKMQTMIKDKTSASDAVRLAYDEVIEQFAILDDETMKQRAADFRDIKNRLLCILSEAGVSFKLSEGSVLVTDELLPSEAIGIKAKAVVCENGGNLSHSAIILKSMNVPAVFSVSGATEKIKSGDLVTVDGINGRVVLNGASIKPEAQAETPELPKGTKLLCSIIS